MSSLKNPLSPWNLSKAKLAMIRKQQTESETEYIDKLRDLHSVLQLALYTYEVGSTESHAAYSKIDTLLQESNLILETIKLLIREELRLEASMSGKCKPLAMAESA